MNPIKNLKEANLYMNPIKSLWQDLIAAMKWAELDEARLQR
jgi:hypothetical protein